MIDRDPFLSFDAAEETSAPADMTSNPGGSHEVAQNVTPNEDTGRQESLAAGNAGPSSRGIIFHRELEQGSDEWLAARCGLLTASEMKLIITPTLKIAANDKQKSHFYELLAQRISGYVEPRYISDDMLRGQVDEIEARALYAKHHVPVEEVGFVTNDRWGFTLGYSPDGKIVGADAGIECKSRRQKYQVQTIVECVPDAVIMPDYVIQAQTGLMVAEWDWIDHISYSGGLPMTVVRVYPDPVIQDAILAAAEAFERQIADKLAIYEKVIAEHKLTPTERRGEQEMFMS